MTGIWAGGRSLPRRANAVYSGFLQNGVGIAAVAVAQGAPDVDAMSTADLTGRVLTLCRSPGNMLAGNVGEKSSPVSMARISRWEP